MYVYVFCAHTEGGKVQKGPLAIGGRLQNTFRATLGGRRNRARKGRGVSLLVPQQQSASQGMPMDVAAAVGVLFAPWGCASETAAASLAAMGAPPGMSHTHTHTRTLRPCSPVARRTANEVLGVRLLH